MVNLWITWEVHRRSRELASAFSCELVEVISTRSRFLRYFESSIKTIWALIKARPKIVFVQSPSSVAAYLCALLKKLFGYSLIIDAHNSVPNQFQRGGPLLRHINSFAVSKADYVIVTNERVGSDVKSMGGKCLNLPDRQPEIEASRSEVFFDAQRPYITLIASYQPDEPIETILTALTKDLKGTVFVTGKKPAASTHLDHFKDSGVIFTGFLPEDEYNRLIASSDLLIDATTDDAILVCGGYEAIAVKVPAVVSNTDVSRNVFRSGFLYADPTVESYKAVVKEYFKDPLKYQTEISSYHQEYPQLWNKWFENVKREIKLDEQHTL